MLIRVQLLRRRLAKEPAGVKGRKLSDEELLAVHKRSAGPIEAAQVPVAA